MERGATGPDPMLGRVIVGRYRMEAAVGSGGMGTVYRASQLGLDRKVAIKVLHQHHWEDSEVVARFEREMNAAARIEHPNTVRVYDFGTTEEGELYLVMEFLDGRSLQGVLERRGPMEPARIAHIGKQVAAALAAAHAAGVIHRDLKPDNVMLLDRAVERDVVKVLDFGLARFGEGASAPSSARLTASDIRVGTPNTMAPEYIRRAQIDNRSDLYALGVLLFNLATGRDLYEGSPYEVLTKHVLEPAPSASAVRGERLPRWLEQVIRKLLEKDPDHRYSSATEVQKLLEPHARSWTVQAHPVEESVLRAALLVGGAAVGGLVAGGTLLALIAWLVRG